MAYYPVNLDIRRRNCLVVGGGAVGTRKVRSLLECGAVVTVVSLETTETVDRLAGEGRIRLRRRPYRTQDLEGMFLVIGATDDEGLNRRIHADAERNNMLCNIADRPEACNFILPAIVRRGDLTIAVSTSGASPAFAKHLKQQLQKQFGAEHQRFLVLMRAVRKRLLAECHAPEAHKPLFERLISENLLDSIRDHDMERVDAVLQGVLGPGCDHRSLLEGLDPDEREPWNR